MHNKHITCSQASKKTKKLTLASTRQPSSSSKSSRTSVVRATAAPPPVVRAAPVRAAPVRAATDEEIAAQEAYLASSLLDDSPPGSWSCHMCSFRNTNPDGLMCEICMSIRVRFTTTLLKQLPPGILKLY